MNLFVSTVARSQRIGLDVVDVTAAATAKHNTRQ